MIAPKNVVFFTCFIVSLFIEILKSHLGFIFFVYLFLVIVLCESQSKTLFRVSYIFKLVSTDLHLLLRYFRISKFFSASFNREYKLNCRNNAIFTS